MNVQKIKVENQFAKKALMRGGRSKAQAIAKADASINRTKPKYQEWVSDYISALEVLFQEANSSDGFNAEIFDAAYLKTAHLRNLGSTFGHEMATAVADRLCELLYRLIDLGFNHGPAIAAVFNALKLVTSKKEFHGVSVKVYAGFLDELDKVVNLFPVVTDRADSNSTAKKPALLH